MKERRHILGGFLGFLVVLALIVPTVAADHNTEVAGIWNDAGLNIRLGQANAPAWNDAGIGTRVGQTDASVWNDASLQPWVAQVKTVGWNDVVFKTRRTPDNTVGWNDGGTNAGRLWFYSAARG